MSTTNTAWFYIKSRLNGDVIDITGSNTAPATHLISYPQDVPATDDQLWELVPV